MTDIVTARLVVLSEVGEPPQHGLRRRGASMLPARCNARYDRCEVAVPIVLAGRSVQSNGTGVTELSGGGLGPFELGAVNPDAMKDDRHFSCDRDPRFAVARRFCEANTPFLQFGPARDLADQN